jgi:indole-3-glycerol phosphate synthase
LLDQILATKRREVAARRSQLPLSVLLDRISESEKALFLPTITQPGVNIIAEIKYQSPSRGPFKCRLKPREVAAIYQENGAAALSVLTDQTYFAGNLDFLAEITRRHEREEEHSIRLPALCKDFILDRYQIAEAAGHGASAYLLIVSALSPEQLTDLLEYGKDFGLDALVEIHDPFELEKAIESGARLIGVNNRDLRTFKIDLDISFDIAKRMEREFGYALVSESGISEPLQIAELRDAGFSAFLVGSVLMDADDPGRKLRELKGES